MVKHINVVMGGPSAEHEVSLATGWEMFKNLDRSKYKPRLVVITKEKTFFYSDNDSEKGKKTDLSNPEKVSHFNGPYLPAESQIVWQNCDVALLALHGEFGEDGTFQGFLDTLGIAYTGSGVFSSSLGMNKIATKQLYEKNNLKTPPHSIYYTQDTEITIDKVLEKHGLPCFVKCPQSGSSRLLGRADTRGKFEEMIQEFSKYSSQILIETLITGDEYSIPILEYPDGTIHALPPILIKPVRSAFFDYTAKYSTGECDEIVPAPCSADLTARLQAIALQAHRILLCNGLSRTDMIVNDEGIFVLETNTLPGFTSASLAPKAFIAQGGSYSELLDILIETARSRKKE